MQIIFDWNFILSGIGVSFVGCFIAIILWRFMSYLFDDGLFLGNIEKLILREHRNLLESFMNNKEKTLRKRLADQGKKLHAEIDRIAEQSYMRKCRIEGLESKIESIRGHTSLKD